MQKSSNEWFGNYYTVYCYESLFSQAEFNISKWLDTLTQKHKADNC